MLAFRVVSIKLPTNYTGKAFKGCDMRIGCNGKRIYFLLAISAKLDNEARSTREWLQSTVRLFCSDRTTGEYFNRISLGIQHCLNFRG